MSIRVNGEFIPEDAIRVELQRLVRFYAEHMPHENLRAQLGQLLQQAKDQAIGGRLLLDEARRRRIAVPDREVQARMRQLVAQVGGEEAFRDALRRGRISEEALVRSVTESMQVDRLVDEIAGRPEPTEAEARAYFDRHADEFRTAERVRLRHILIVPDSSSDEDRAVARSRLEDLRRRIEEGEDFETLARLHSECPTGRQAGGLLGWVSRGMTIPGFERVVFTLPEGTVSEVIESPMGMHLVQVLQKEAERAAVFEEVRDRILDLIRHNRRGHAISQYVRKLRERAVIEDDGEEISLDDIQWPDEDEN